MNKKEKSTLIYSIILLVLFIALAIGFITYSDYIYKFNRTQFEYNSNEKTDIFEISISPTDTWGKDINGDNVFDYYGTTYSIDIQNLGENIISSWNMKLNIQEDCFLNQAWNGSVEIHQKSSTEEKSQILNLQHNFQEKEIEEKDVKLEYTMLETILAFNMHQGDCVIYLPKQSAKETPIEVGEENNSKIEVGIIFYTQKQELLDLSNYTIDYQLYKEYNDTPLFYSLLSGCFIWAILSSIFLAIYFNMKLVNKRFSQDNKIIAESILVFTQFFDAKDPYTKGHSQRVAYYSKLIAERIGLSENECRQIYYIGLMHDCGKCYIPDEILKKPSKLTKEEYEIIKTHTTHGAEMLKDFTSIKNIRDGVLYHHERYDGKGYPTGLSGEKIPLIARIICLADALDAMNSSRCYRSRLSKSYIVSEIKNNEGKQFDPYLAEVVLKLIEEEKIILSN